MSIQPTLFGTQILVPSNTTPIGPVDSTIKTVDNGAAGIDSGVIAGEVFRGKGNSFLDPNTILSTVDVFSNSIGAGGLLANNPQSLEIQGTTQNAINDIFSRNFIPSQIIIPLLNLPLALPIPDLGNNPTASQINLASLFTTNVIRSTTTAGIVPPTTLSFGDAGTGTTNVGNHFSLPSTTTAVGDISKAADDTTTPATTGTATTNANTIAQLTALYNALLGALNGTTGATTAAATPTPAATTDLTPTPAASTGLTPTPAATTGVDNTSVAPSASNLLALANMIPTLFATAASTPTTQTNTGLPIPVSSAGTGTINPNTSGLLQTGTGIITSFGTPVPADPGPNTINANTNGLLQTGTGIITNFGTPVPADPGANQLNANTTGLLQAGTGIINQFGTPVPADPGANTLNANTTGLLQTGTGIISQFGKPVPADPGAGNGRIV